MRAPARPGTMRRPTTSGARAKTGARAKSGAKASKAARSRAGRKAAGAQPGTEVGARPAQTRSLHRVSTQLAQRLAERRRALRRMRLRTVAIVTGVVAAVAAVVYLVAFSPALALRAEEVQVLGAGDLVDTAALTEVTDAYAGEPLVRLSTGDLADQAGEVTGVLDAKVSRQWPRGLQVHITPREPVAAVPHEDGYLVLDAQAVELDLTDEPLDGLPVVDVEVGSDSAAAALDAVVTVLGELPPELFDEVAGAGASSSHQVELELADGSQVVWGSAEEGELKASVLSTLRQVPAGVYDVSAPRHPITRD